MNYIIDILSDYPDLVGIATIPMIIAILAISLPLLIQTIGRIDDKYNSTKIIMAFKKEPRYVAFWIILSISLLSYLFWILQLPRLGNWGGLNDFIDNSALVFLTICTILLVFITLRLVSLILIYYQVEKLFEHLKKRYK